MDVFVYGSKRPLAGGFEEFVSVADTAIVSIDLHQGHLADSRTAHVQRPGRAKWSTASTASMPPPASSAFR